MKLLNSKIHGILDYVVVVFLWSSTLVVPFTPWVKTFTLALGLTHLLLTLCTHFPAGVVKILPFKIHGIIELSVSILLLVSTRLLNLQGVDGMFYVGFGIVVFLTWASTDYNRR